MIESDQRRFRDSLLADPSFLGVVLTQFLAVFNDNFYKQIVIFLCGEKKGTAAILFSLPFILFSGYCGYLSDLLSKRTIIVIAKLAEIAIMLLGLAAFYSGSIVAMFGVLFLLGMHSSLYGPAKYGLLPELFVERQLPQVNGIFQLTMFLAIILGIALSGFALDLTGGKSWMTSIVCIVIAALGFGASLMIRPVPAARPRMRFMRADLFLNRETWSLLREDRRLSLALLATSVFWAAGGLLYPLAITDLGEIQFLLTRTQTSRMAAGTGLGIAIGCVIGMVLSRGYFNAKLIRTGSWGMLISMILLALPGSSVHTTFLGIEGAAAMLVVLGVFAGLYSVPLQVFIQARAPEEHKGRVMGAMNLANWIGIYCSGVLHLVVHPLVVRWELPENLMFGVGALFFLPVVLFYHPRSEQLADSPKLDALPAGGTID